MLKIIQIVSWELNQQIEMICEGLCDKDLSNAAENSTLHRIQLHLNIY